tara:strand:+ start:550 stop:1041 length:492 start_codon:yes stop_codon:yes gene_type:complete
MKNPIIEKHMREIYLNQVLDQYVQTILKVDGIDVREKGRKRPKVDLVKIFCFHANHNLQLSSTRIGEYLKRDHATVLHACRKYDELYFSDKDFREKADFYIEIFKGIDGLDNLEPNKDALFEIIPLLSEATRGKVLKWIMQTELVIKYPEAIEVYEEETIAND